MGVVGDLLGGNKAKIEELEAEVITSVNKQNELQFQLQETRAEINAGSRTGIYKPLFRISYDGEKNSGELEPLTIYDLDYEGLRIRSWKSYLDDEVTQTVINKFTRWIIGSGLKLQSEPVNSITGMTDDQTDSFKKSVEDRFKLFASSKMADYHRRDNLHKIASRAFLNSKVGGDVLVIVRVEDGFPNVQLVDGSHVRTPYGDEAAKVLKRGNVLKNGIEMNKRKEHVAYYVQVVKERTETSFDRKFIRVEAKGKRNKREMAFMVYGLEYRIDDNRGIPLISTVLETLKKLDRYKEAAVGSAEERAKINYFIEHGTNSTGENPLIKDAAQAFNVNSSAGDNDIPIDVQGKQLADKVYASTGKQTFNLPNDATMKSLDSKAEINFEGFYRPNVEMICSTINMPPEVALSKYDSNFSASRAALKDWEHVIMVDRSDFSNQFYNKIYSFWLELEIMKGNVQAPGYINAVGRRDFISVSAYTNSRFIGANVPHIDPVKEVTAERMKLGAKGANLPLTTAEKATEALGGGDYSANVSSYSKELDEAEDAGIDSVSNNVEPK